ncbi:hypothetical protein GCM10010532_061760 [Dactylosporangium siamense]|uniref:Uncharacterized protein n=1 Tax=Dactylosporangium siamense TaxID=685454 RepID=A0A919PWV7_9ACTN|nr:hypothetical protein Dsi01nite_087620 [Dactylosporangium siamense]
MRRIATGAAVVAAVALVGLAVPALAADPVAATLGCRLYFSDAGTGTSPTSWNDTFTLTQSPASPAAGQTVTVTLAAAAGVTNGPVPLNAGDVPVRVTVAVGGAQTGTVTLNQTAYPASAKAAAVPLGPISATGTYTATTAGTVTLTVRQVAFANVTATTYCSATGDRDHKVAPVDTPITLSSVVAPAPSGSPSPSASASASASPSPSVSPSASASASPSASASSTEATTAAETFGPKSVTMRCKTLSTIRDWTATHTLSMSPTNPGYGANVTITYTFDNGGKNGPAPITAGDLKPTATVKLSGAQSGTVKLAGPAYGAIAAQATVPGATLTGQFTAGTPGLVTLTVADILFDHPQVDTECNNGSDPVTGPADTTIVAKFTVKSTAATAAEAAGQALPKTGDGGILPVLLLWGTALLLTGAGALVVLPARARRRAALHTGLPTPGE